MTKIVFGAKKKIEKKNYRVLGFFFFFVCREHKFSWFLEFFSCSFSTFLKNFWFFLNFLKMENAKTMLVLSTFFDVLRLRQRKIVERTNIFLRFPFSKTFKKNKKFFKKRRKRIRKQILRTMKIYCSRQTKKQKMKPRTSCSPFLACSLLKWLFFTEIIRFSFQKIKIKTF